MVSNTAFGFSPRTASTAVHPRVSGLSINRKAGSASPIKPRWVPPSMFMTEIFRARVLKSAAFRACSMSASDVPAIASMGIELVSKKRGAKMADGPAMASAAAMRESRQVGW